MISIKHLVKTYRSKKVIVKALDSVNIDFPDRGMVFVLGKSGSGKSTLLNIIGGLDKPDSGEIIVNEKSSKQFTDSEYDGYRNTYVGFIFQEYNILNEFNVQQNIELALQIQGKKNTAAEAEKILRSVGLEGLSNRKPNTLSGGQKQRVAIARALIKNPSIILADEPTGALDSETGKEVLDTLKKLSADRLVLVVSHDREYAEKYGDRIIELKDGKIISDTSLKIDNRGNTTLTVEIQSKNVSFIKSQLPFLRAIKIGANSLKTKPIRLVITVFISLIAFGMFGVVSTMMMYDVNYTAAKALEGTLYNSAYLQKKYDTTISITYYDYYDRKMHVEPQSWVSDNITAIEASEVEKYNNSNLNVKFAGIFGMEEGTSLPKIEILNYATSSNTPTYYNYDYFTGFTDVGDKYISDVFGQDSLISGAYPIESDEIAISEYMFDVIKYKGLREYVSEGEYGKKIEIDSPSDVVGKQMDICYNEGGGFKQISVRISGVYFTGEISEKYEALKSKTDTVNNDLSIEFSQLMNGFHNIAFVSDDFYRVNIVHEKQIDSMNFITETRANLISANSSFLTIGDYYLNSNRNSFNFTLPKWLSEFSDDTKLYSFDNGTPISAAEALNLGDDETYLASENFWSRLKLLYEAKKINAFGDENNAVISSYVDNHKDFLYAYYNYHYFCYGAWLGDYDDLPAEKTITDHDIEILITSLNTDWNEWVKDGYHGSTAANYKFGDVDKFYYSDNNFLNIRGVYILETKSVADSILINEKFIDAVGLSYSYSIESRNTKYVKSDNGKYAALLTPLYTTMDRLEYILSLNKPIADDSYFEMSNNEIYSSAVSAGKTFENISWIFMIAGIGLAVMSALFLFNYISISIVDKRREIGILRALGAKRIDIFKIFFSESFIIAAICTILAVTAALISCSIINSFLVTSVLAVELLNFRFLNGLVIFGIGVFVSFIGTFFPVYFASRKVPVESIRSL